MSQDSKPGFFGFVRNSVRRLSLSSNDDENTGQQEGDVTRTVTLPGEGSGLAEAGDSYGSLSEIGGSGFISPSSSSSSINRSLTSPRTLMSPLLGENLLDTDAEDDASLERFDADLLPGMPGIGTAASSSSPSRRLNLPPMPPRPSSASSPVKAYPDAYQNATTPRGGVVAVGESPSSVNAQPGDWNSAGLSHETGNGAGVVNGAGAGDGASLSSNGGGGGATSAAPRWSILMNMAGTPV